MKIKFRVFGQPQGKQRPRMFRVNWLNVTYTPRQTTEYERLIRASYTAVSKVKFQKGEPLEISILAIFSIPQRASKKLKN